MKLIFEFTGHDKAFCNKTPGLSSLQFVKHSFVKQVRDWPHSTFHRYVREGIYDESWGDSGIEVNDGEFGE